jgi:outer membrane protein assembly factor BamB
MRHLALLLLLTPIAAAADWPQWRGPNRDGVSKETGLLKEWPKDGPPLRWKATDIGTGYSTPSVAGGRVYLQTTIDGQEYALALNEADGKEAWKTPIGKVGPNKGMDYSGTRSTPTVDGDHLYCLASDGQLACLDKAGKVKWTKNLARDFGGKVGNWAYTESVLVDGDLVVCTPGGKKAALAALNKTTGEPVWMTERSEEEIADYASIMPVETGRGKEYVQFFRGGVIGVDAKTGKFLWRYTATIAFGANILTPVVQGNKVFTSGSRAGGGLIELVATTDGVEAKEIYFEKKIAPSIGGAVLVDGHLYASADRGLLCAEFATGKIKWTDESLGAASVCAADGMLYARGYNKGDVALIELNPAKYVEKGRFNLPNRSTKYPSWPHPIVANGGLYLRDQDVLACYEVKAK